MCTTARMTYQLTYRALRAFASGRKSTNPIVEMEKMEACVPFSICSHTHDVMMKANRSFNQREIKPVGVHEPIHYCKAKFMFQPAKRVAGKSYLQQHRLSMKFDIVARIHHLKARIWAHKRTGYWNGNHFTRLDAKARAIKATQDLPLFA